MIQDALSRLLDGEDLSRAESRDVMGSIMAGEATPAQIGGFLVALRLKGETPAEIAGAAEAMRAHAVACGRSATISSTPRGRAATAARLQHLDRGGARRGRRGRGRAKHGNRSVSSQSGSADVLEALGFELDLTPERIADSIDTLGFGFMFAPVHHPAMKHAGPVRRELAARTVFNVLGPLTNPAGRATGRRRLLAAPRAGDRRRARAARRPPRVRRARRGRDRRAVAAGPNLVCEVVDGTVTRREIDPLDLGIPRCDPAELRGGDATANAARIREVFHGGNGGTRSAILLNAAGAIAAGGAAHDLARRAWLAREALDSGAAARAPRRAHRVLAGSRGMRFRDALAAPGFGAIAEFKRRSRPPGPAPGGDVADVRTRLRGRRARAMSVLVDERFDGSWDDLRAARAPRTCRCSPRASSRRPSTCARRARQAPTRRC